MSFVTELLFPPRFKPMRLIRMEYYFIIVFVQNVIVHARNIAQVRIALTSLLSELSDELSAKGQYLKALRVTRF